MSDPLVWRAEQLLQLLGARKCWHCGKLKKCPYRAMAFSENDFVPICIDCRPMYPHAVESK